MTQTYPPLGGLLYAGLESRLMSLIVDRYQCVGAKNPGNPTTLEPDNWPFLRFWSSLLTFLLHLNRTLSNTGSEERSIYGHKANSM